MKAGLHLGSERRGESFCLHPRHSILLLNFDYPQAELATHHDRAKRGSIEDTPRFNPLPLVYSLQ